MRLVINNPGTFITQKDECFHFKQQEKVFTIPPQKVENLVICNQAMITSQTVVMALEHNIDVIFLDGYGDPVGRIWFSKMGSTALIRRRQIEAVDSLYIFPFCQDDYRKIKVLGQGFDKKLVNEELLAKFF